MQTHPEDQKRDNSNADEFDNDSSDGTFEKAGSEETGALPNDPAENAKKTSPEEDSGKKEDTRLSAGNSK
jgi:hypothetical protein